jgi:hypothetical protein
VLYLPIHAVTGSLQQRLIDRALESASDLPPGVAQALETARHDSGLIFGLLIGLAFMLVVTAIFSTLGGLVGAMLVARPSPSTSSVPPLPPTP